MSWPDSYLPASFRGVAFECLSTSPEVTRSTVAHSYPFRDGAEIEDLGLQATRHSLRAMLFGANAEAQYQQLLVALEAPGPGELSHPVHGQLQVVVESVRPSFDADNTDSVTLEITFVEDGTRVHVFGAVIPEATLDSVTLATDASWLSAADAFARSMRDLLAVANNNRVTQLVSTLGAVMNQVAALGAAAQNTVQSYLDMPAGMLSDLRQMTAGVLPTESSGVSGSPLVPASAAGFEQARGRLSQVSSFTTLASGTPIATAQDTQLIRAQVQLCAALTLAESAQRVLTVELAAPTATPPMIEAITNTVRSSLQAQIDVLSALYPLETARPLVESLKTVAYRLQQAAQQVIEKRPPLVVKPAPVAGNFRLIAHALYGDHARAAELARLNPLIRRPNFIQQGDALNAFAR